MTSPGSTQTIKERVARPCRPLILCQAANIITLLLLMGLYLLGEEMPTEHEELVVLFTFFGMFLLKIVLSVATAYACWRLINLSSYSLGRLLAILSLVPCCIFINPFEVVFAIWLLFVLKQPEVKLAFDSPPEQFMSLE